MTDKVKFNPEQLYDISVRFEDGRFEVYLSQGANPDAAAMNLIMDLREHGHYSVSIEGIEKI